jgi:glutathione S-transferase
VSDALHKLYMFPFVGSFAVHVALLETGVPFELVLVNILEPGKPTRNGADLASLNPRHRVPVLQHPDGDTLTECVVILQYIADLAPGAGLAPPPGSIHRYKLQASLNALTCDLYQNLEFFYHFGFTPEQKAAAYQRIHAELSVVEKTLTESAYISGEQYGLADIYAYTTTLWMHECGVDLAAYPLFNALCERISVRPAVQAARASEELLKAPLAADLASFVAALGMPLVPTSASQRGGH